MSNYETAKHTAQKLFLSSYQPERIQRFSSKEDETYIDLEFLSTPFRIQKETGACETLSDDGQYVEADFNVAMTLYDLLSYGKGGPFTGDNGVSRRVIYRSKRLFLCRKGNVFPVRRAV